MQDLDPSMLEELRTASSLLEVALDRYATACASLVVSYNPKGARHEMPRGISTAVSGEMGRIGLHETKFGRAKTDINQLRNLIPSVAPINTLSPDILSYIFSLVFHGHDFCRHRSQSDSARFHPETLAHVCSYWRQVTLQSCTFWTHIDLILVTGYRLSERWLDRAAKLASWAGPLPLDIHIVGQTICRADDIRLDRNACDFFVSVAPRVRSLNLSGSHRFGRMNMTALEICLTHCTPTIFGGLVMTGNHPWARSYCNVIRAWDRPVNHVYGHGSDFRLNIPHTHLEDCVFHVTVLRLIGIHFPWDSQAYRGLVELRLVPLWGGYGFTVTRSQLAGILAGSPGLRALELGVRITNPIPQNVTSTHMIDLEILDLRTTDPAEYEAILQLINPGLNPLQLSLKFPSLQLPMLFDDCIQSFFARSAVTELCIQCVAGVEPQIELYETIRALHVPRLRTLSLRNFCLDVSIGSDNHSYRPPSPQAPDENGHELCHRLDALHLTSCSIDLDYLRNLTGVLPIRVLRVADCLVWSEAGGIYNAKHHEDELLEAVSVVEFGEEPGELWEWNPWA